MGTGSAAKRRCLYPLSVGPGPGLVTNPGRLVPGCFRPGSGKHRPQLGIDDRSSKVPRRETDSRPKASQVGVLTLTVTLRVTNPRPDDRLALPTAQSAIVNRHSSIARVLQLCLSGRIDAPQKSELTPRSVRCVCPHSCGMKPPFPGRDVGCSARREAPPSRPVRGPAATLTPRSRSGL